ncbi:MAG: hypothetical protein WC602_00590 [archaeon]
MLVTTSQRPSIATRALAFRAAKEIRAEFVCRGKRSLLSIISRGNREGHGALLLFTGRRGIPFSVKAIELRGNGWHYLLESELGSGFNPKEFAKGISELLEEKKL